MSLLVLALGVIVGLLLVQCKQQQRMIKILEWNRNFNCYTGSATEHYGDELIRREQRRVKSGLVVLCAADIAGMGEMNDRVGEVATNYLMAQILTYLSSKRDILLLGQKNYGDEFAWFCNVEDAQHLCDSIDIRAKELGFKGAYSHWAVINPDESFQQVSDSLMEQVYEIKKERKRKAST